MVYKSLLTGVKMAEENRIIQLFHSQAYLHHWSSYTNSHSSKNLASYALEIV